MDIVKICDVVLNCVWFDPRVRKQIKEYIRNGIEVCCVGLKGEKYDEQKISKIPCKITIVDIDEKYKKKLKTIVMKLRREYLINKQITNAIIKASPDVIHANDLDALIPAYKAAKKLKCKIIYDSHEIYTENNSLMNKKLYALWLGFREKMICKKIDKMICVSNAAAEYFERELKIGKPTVITNCVLKSEQVFDSEKNQDFEILNHGQFYPGRGYDIMLDAAKILEEHKEIKMVIRGMGIMEKQLREKKEELKADNFVMVPPVNVSELIEKASHSMVGVAITEKICLNFELSVSNKLFEYLAAGLPVIMSDIPEHRYLNDKYGIGIILKEDTAEELAAAVLKLYQDKDFYNKCAQNAKKISDEINWENEFSKLIKIEKELMENK